MAEIIRRAPLFAAFLFIVAGCFLVAWGQGWYINGLIPVPLVGALIVGVGLFMVLFLLPGWARTAPKIVADGLGLRATTPLWRRIMLVFSAQTTLVIDKKGKYLIYTSRSLWFRKREEIIRFRDIDHINYERDALNQLERFTLGLVLKKGGTLPLFEYRGHQDEPKHETAARTLLDQLRRHLGLGLSKSSDDGEDSGSRECPSCGRKGPPTKTRCLYCGTVLGAVERDLDVEIL